MIQIRNPIGFFSMVLFGHFSGPKILVDQAIIHWFGNIISKLWKNSVLALPIMKAGVCCKDAHTLVWFRIIERYFVT